MFSHQNLFCNFTKKIGEVVQLAIILSSGTIWGKSRLNETVFRVSPCFDSEQKTMERVVTSALYVSRGTFWKKTWRCNKLYLFQIEWLIFGRVENRNLRVQKKVSGKYFEKIFLWPHSRSSSINPVRLSARGFPQVFQNWILCVQKEKLKEKIFHGKFRLYSSFPDFERWIIVIFVKKGFRGACQKCLLRVPKTFWGKQSFKHFILCDLFQILSVTFWQNGQNCLYVSIGTFLENFPYWKSFFCCRFHTLCETFSQLLQTKLAVLSN